LYAFLGVGFNEGTASFPLINSRKKSKNKNYKDSGTLHIQELKVDEKKSFLDYLQNGLKLHWTLLIDFSSHNKAIKLPQSYHYVDGEEDNRYVSAIKAIGMLRIKKNLVQ